MKNVSIQSRRCGRSDERARADPKTRHGWGCEADPERAVQFLSAAASNAASIEEAALTAGSKKGGSAKGELVLAIYELANSYRNGWGVKKDPVAAKHYLEVAANLGDTGECISNPTYGRS